MSFRPVALPDGVPGRLYLSAMPGGDDWEGFLSDLAGAGIDAIVSLESTPEIERKSPAYAKAIEEGDLPCARMEFPIPDFGVPGDRDRYTSFVAEVADAIRSGGSVLVHCGAGIGRTGTFAVCLLIALGAGAAEALERVGSAGSRPETEGQRELISWYAGFARDGGG